jgi:hypothetical protein
MPSTLMAVGTEAPSKAITSEAPTIIPSTTNNPTTDRATVSPTVPPTQAPTTNVTSQMPTMQPTGEDSIETQSPTIFETIVRTDNPTAAPSEVASPTSTPTVSPTSAPTIKRDETLNPTTSSNTTIVLSAFSLAYTIEQSRIPFAEEVSLVVNRTDTFLAYFFNRTYRSSNLLETVTIRTNDAFGLGEPYTIEYETSVVFASSSAAAPDVMELDQTLAQAFSVPTIQQYINEIESLPPTNIFASVTDITFTQDDSAGGSRSVNPNTILFGVTVFAGILALALSVVAAAEYRRHKRDGRSERRPGKYSAIRRDIDDHSTTNGESCDNSTGSPRNTLDSSHTQQAGKTVSFRHDSFDLTKKSPDLQDESMERGDRKRKVVCSDDDKQVEHQEKTECLHAAVKERPPLTSLPTCDLQNELMERGDSAKDVVFSDDDNHDETSLPKGGIECLHASCKERLPNNCETIPPTCELTTDSESASVSSESLYTTGDLNDSSEVAQPPTPSSRTKDLIDFFSRLASSSTLPSQ